MEVRMKCLLHDIGKFYQRTGITVDNINFSYPKSKVNNLDKKQIYTMKFMKDWLSNKLPDYQSLYEDCSENQNIDDLIQLADSIATGHEKSNEQLHIDDKKQINDIEKKGEHIIKRLDSIFNEVSLSSKLNNNYIAMLKPLSNFKYIAIKERTNYLEGAKKEYLNLYNQMIKELKERKINEIENYNVLHHNFYPIIKEYTTAVPSDPFNVELSAVSLFDHLKLSTAIASCLSKSNNDKQFILLDYDLSGIQNYIFTITEGDSTKDKIAKQLRSRSFYLSLLSDFIAYYIIDAFDLSYENILYSSGGRGRLLIPNTMDFNDKIKLLNEKIECFLFKNFKTLLSVSLSYNIVSAEELQTNNLSDLTSYETKHDISTKSNKFASILSSQESYIDVGMKKCCEMCEKIEAKNQKLCDVCNLMLLLNDKVLTKSTQYIFEFCYHNEITDEPELSVKFGDLGFVNIYFTDPYPNTDAYYVSINCHKLGETKYYAIHDNILDFNTIANNSQGDPKIAVLKMDVDNLGYIFYRGIKKSKQTISKSLTLSRMMEYFFTKKIKEICKKEKYNNSIYINYSGGDDLLFIVPASMSIEIANDIMQEFNDFIGNNNSLTISAGIEIFKPKAPIRFAVLEAERNLEESKNQEGKNHLTVLDCSISNNRLPFIIEQINRYTDALNNDLISTTGLYKIYTAILNSLEHENKDKEFYRYIPQIAYTIKRNVNNDFFEEFKKIFITPNINLTTLIEYKVIFGYALMSSRNEKGE